MEQLELFVPDRFDVLQRRAPNQLNSIIVPVDAALEHVSTVHGDMKAAGRGAFTLLRGDSGSGKSTFLHTVSLFRNGVEVASIPREANLRDALRTVGRTQSDLRILVVEGREALSNVSLQELEAAIHEINGFIRSRSGESTLVVWPCNADDLQNTLIEICRRVGADSLLGVGEPYLRFLGPPKEQFLDIASRTIGILNEGASLTDLGVSESRTKELIDKAPTIGSFLGLLRQELLRNEGRVRKLIAQEQCRLWIVVVAGNEPENDVAALTRGNLSIADIDRMMAATQANIVEDLKRFPEQIGILGAVLDAKILHLPILTALGIAREFANEQLRTLMKEKGLSITTQGSPLDRLHESDLGRAFQGSGVGPRTRGAKAGSNTQESFRRLADIAVKNDELLNRTIGAALTKLGLINKCEVEKDLGKGLTRRTDVVCYTTSGTVRLEMMWRAKTSRAEIANYTLTKLYQYGRAIGFLS